MENREREIIILRDLRFKGINEIDPKRKRPGVIIHFDEKNMINYCLSLKSIDENYKHHRLRSFSLRKEHGINLDKKSLIDLRYVYAISNTEDNPIAIMDEYYFQEVVASVIENQQAMRREFGIVDEDFLSIEEKLMDKMDPKILKKVMIKRQRDRRRKKQSGIYEKLIKQTYSLDN